MAIHYHSLADECLGHAIVEKVYDNFRVPTALRCRARMSLPLHSPKTDPKLRRFLHSQLFEGVDKEIAGMIYAANKHIASSVAQWFSGVTVSVVVSDLPWLPLDHPPTADDYRSLQWPNGRVTLRSTADDLIALSEN